MDRIEIPVELVRLTDDDREQFIKETLIKSSQPAKNMI